MLSAPLVHGAYQGGPSFEPGALLVMDFVRGRYRRGPGRGRLASNPAAIPDWQSVGHAGFGRTRVNGAYPPFAPDTPLIGDGGLLAPESLVNGWANQIATTWLAPSGGSVVLSAAPSAGLPSGPWDYRTGLTPDVTTRLDAPSYSVTPGTRTTIRHMVRRKGPRYFNMRIRMSEVVESNSYDNVCFDLETLTVAYSSNAAYTAAIYLDADGRIWVSISAVVGAGRTVASLYLYPLDAPLASASAPVPPASATDGFTLYYSEIVAGPDLRGPPIWTTGLPATRPAVAQSVGGLGGILTPPFVAFVEVSGPPIDGVDRPFLDLSDGTASNRFSMSRTAGNFAGCAGYFGGVFFNAGGAAGTTGALNLKAAVRVRSNEIRRSNGGVLGASTAIAFTSLSKASLGCNWNGTTQGNVYVKRVLILPDMDDAQFAVLTA